MKTIRLLFLVLLTAQLAQGQELDVHHYTVAKSGLNVRVMPNLGAPKVFAVPYLTEVKILAESGVTLSIVDDGKTLSGQWIKIQFKDQNKGLLTGFVFDQFVKPISVITKDHFELLAQYLSLETLLQYDEYQRLIRQEDQDAIELYSKARNLKKEIDEEFNRYSRLNVEKLLSDLRGFEKNTLGVYSSCVAECTVYSMEQRISDFVKQSNEDRERIFFSILKTLAPNGDLKGSYHPVWTKQVCDYAGYSKLGNRLIYNNLKKIKAYLDEHTESEQDLSYKMLKTLRNTVIRQLKMRSYGSTQEKVITELNDILSDGVLLDDEYDQVKEALVRAENGFITYGSRQVEIEFACATTRCTVCF
jgi:hypothetical protein